MSNTELIPSLPLDIAVDILLRVPLQSHSALQQVCHSWRSFVLSPSYYQTRNTLGYTDCYGCFIQAMLPSPSPGKTPLYAVSVYDAKKRTWDQLPCVPDFANGLPLFCQCIAVGSKIVLLGGWDPSSWAVLKCVYVYDFSVGQWRRGSDMPSSRSFFACASFNGNIVVAGGHDSNKNALRSTEMYSVDKDEWEAMPDMNEERDECKAAVMGGKIVVISGFSTESQGQFGRSAEIYVEEENKWQTIDNMLPAAIQLSSVTSLKGQVYAVFDGKLMRYKAKEEQWEAVAEIPKGARVPACVLPLGEAIFLLSAQADKAYKCCVGVSAYAWKEMETSGGVSGIVQAACTLDV